MSIFSEWGIRDGKDRFKEEVLYNLAACYVRAEREIARVLSKKNLSPVKMNALMMIKHVGKDKGLSQSELAKRMIVSPGNITRLMDRLMKEKLVTRTPDPKDRRVNTIQVTDKAAKLLEEVWPVYKETVNRFICLDENQARMVSDLLATLRKES